MHRLPALLLCTVLLSSIVLADRERDAIERLMNAQTSAQLAEAVAHAEKEGLPAQMITETKLIFALRSSDTVALSALLPKLEQAALNFRAENSPGGISNVEQFRGLISYVKALQAAEEEDESSFRDEITKAFWLFPQQAELFGTAVAKYQLREKMARWLVDFSTPLLVSGGKVTTLAEVLGPQKAMLLVFWSSASPASQQVLPTLQALANHLKLFGVVVAGVNADAREGEVAAEKQRAELKLDLPWLVEGRDHTLTRQFEVTSLPRALLVTHQGRITFHSHPQDPDLWKALKRAVPSVVPMK